MYVIGPYCISTYPFRGSAMISKGGCGRIATTFAEQSVRSHNIIYRKDSTENNSNRSRTNTNQKTSMVMSL